MKAIGANFSAVQGSLIAAGRIQETLHRRPAVPCEFEKIPPPLELHSGIRFENVSFHYREGQPVLRQLSFTIPAGQTVGIVGNSGGGKSTLIHLILRLYDVSDGRITLDGRDLREIPPAQVRQSIAMVFQDNFLFSGSIRENIQLGDPSANGERLLAAVRGAFLEEFIAALPQGLDSPVGERGILLSGGQKQRIAIARAMLKDAPIIILDEATSSLDSHSEAVVQRALDNLTRNKTVLSVAHRLSTLARAQTILVVDGGRIVESGSEKELLAIPNGFYRRLHGRQFARAERG
jgi:subfamily B ATP-binding cassette protein MsbA